MSNLLPVAGNRQVAATLGAELRRHPRLGTAALAVQVAAVAAGLVAPWVLGRLVDQVIAGATTGDIVRSAAIIAGAALVAGTLTAVASALTARLGETVLARLRERVLDRVLHSPAGVIERAGTGDLVSRAGEDVSVVTTAITDSAPPLIGALLSVTLTAVGLFALDWRLGLAGLVAVPAYALALRWYLPKSMPFYARERIATGERTQAMAGALHGAATVRAYRLEDHAVGRIADRSAAARDLSLDVFNLYTRFGLRINRAEFIGLAAVLVTGFLLVRGEMTTVGAATAAALYFHRLFNPIGMLMMEADSVLHALASLARLVGVADLPAAPPSASTPVAGELEIRVTGHRYDDGPVVLADVRLTLAPGERVALVGASGAGKSTLAGIAAGVVAPSDGTVRLGGWSLTDLGPGRTRRSIALVSQEVHVFAGPLASDLRLARPEASDDEVRAALDKVGARWVSALPDGLATEVGEGGHRLTAAQAQQVALARLILADPPVAILDEATAEAGSAGARDLDQAAVAATAGRTALVVAHRLSQAAGADRVVVMSHGRIIEEGTHEELLAARGDYSRLWRDWSR